MIFKFLNRYKAIALLIIVEAILFWTNYKQGTFLVGWDNVYSELNFNANIQRSIFSIWQEYRGLGVVDGMAHAALLPHTLFTLLLSKFFPLNLIRYITHFVLHLLGGIGIYFLLKKLVDREIEALFGALFYILNLVTIQMFFTPLEVFSYHFAALPILIYFTNEFLEKGRKKRLILFSLLSILSLPQAHVPSVFLVYFFAISVTIIFKFLSRITNWKRSLLILLIIFLVNSFWGLPYLYTAATASKTIVNSKINQMSTDNIVARNKQFGDFVSVALLRGFTLDYVDFQPSGENDYMMKTWRNYTRNPLIFLISVGFFGLCMVGIFDAINSKRKKLYPFLAIFLIAFLMLGNNIPIFSLVSNFINSKIPFFYNVFRFAFTKFSIIFVFSYSIFLCHGLALILSKARNYKKDFNYLTLLPILLLVIYTWPTFAGEFIYNNLRVPISSQYFDVFNFFKTQNLNSRIAILPQPSYWGWVYYSWGARGSGFIWYGLPQASLDGAFYPWSNENENYYWEVNHAIYSGNKQLLEKVFDKYQINWLVTDSSLLSPFSPKALYLDKLEDLVNQMGIFKLEKTFGTLNIYKVNSITQINNYIFTVDNISRTGPKHNWNDNDLAYQELGNYIDSSNLIPEAPTVYYPFRSLFTGRAQDELEFQVQDLGDYFSFEAQLPPELAGFILRIPKLESDEVVEINESDVSNSSVKYPEVIFDGQPVVYDKSNEESQEFELNATGAGILEVRVPKIWGVNSFDSNSTNELLTKEPRNCEQLINGVYKHDVIEENEFKYLRLTSINSSNCMDIDFPKLSHKSGYLFTIEGNNISGSPILLSIINKNSHRTDLETYLNNKPGLSYLVIPPMEEYALGYSIHIDNDSIGKVKTVNDLVRITVNPIPYRFLTGIKIVKQSSEIDINPSSSNSDGISIDHPNPSYYQVQLDSSTIGGVHSATPEVSLSQSNNVTLVLSQSFDEGWKAYEIKSEKSKVKSFLTSFFPFWFGEEFKDHVLVNNWENGWGLEPRTENLEPRTIVIVYLPQYLEYIGFFLLGIGIVIIFFYKNRTRVL